MLNKNSDVLDKIRKNSRHVNKEIKQNNSKNIISYCRVSDSKQIDNYSPEVQSNHIKRFGKNEGLKIVKTLTVLGESSKKGSKRPSIDELKHFIQTTKHKIHAIVVFHSNRFTRDGVFGADFVDYMISKGIGFIDLNDPNDIFTDRGRLKQIDAFYDAEYDNLNRKTFINAITLEKLKQGYTMRRPPRGYKLFKENKSKSIKQRVIITEEGKLIQQALRLKLDYNYSNVMISEIMKPRGLIITSKGVGEVLRNVYYCGYIKDKRLIEYDGYVQGIHPQMITPEEFEFLNYSKEKRIQIRRKEVEQLPLKRHLICSNCNQKLTGYAATNRKDLFYYKCPTNGCGLNIKSETIHNLYVEKLKTFSFNKNYLPQLKNMLDEVFKMLNESNIKLQKQLNTKITELEDERFLAIRNMNADPETKSVLKELIDYCDDDLAYLKEQLDNIKVGGKEVKNNLMKVLEFINDLPSLWLNSDFVFRIKLQELVFPRGIWYNKSSNNLIAPKTNPIFNIIKDLYCLINQNPKDFNVKSTNKGSENNNEKKNKVRTLNFLKNMPVTPSIIRGYEYHIEVLRNEKIPLVVLLSDGSNISTSSNTTEIVSGEPILLSDRSNNFSNELYDSTMELMQFVDLYRLCTYHEKN